MEDRSVVATSTNLNEFLLNEVSRVQSDLIFISAFCKVDILKHIDANILDENISKTLIVRFRLSDILAGVTDFEIIDYCKMNKWKLRILLDLHAKTYIFDNRKVIIGSANLTQNGIGISNTPNTELSALFELSYDEVQRLKLEFSKAMEISDDMLLKMTDELSNASQSNINIEWSEEIQKTLSSEVSVLFVEDFDELKPENFHTSRPYRWLINVLEDSNDEGLYFGSLSEKLHNTLINEPKPYRKDVKNILSYLLKLCQDNVNSNIEIFRPQHSQLIKLTTDHKIK